MKSKGTRHFKGAPQSNTTLLHVHKCRDVANWLFFQKQKHLFGLWGHRCSQKRSSLGLCVYFLTQNNQLHILVQQNLLGRLWFNSSGFKSWYEGKILCLIFSLCLFIWRLFEWFVWSSILLGRLGPFFLVLNYLVPGKTFYLLQYTHCSAVFYFWQFKNVFLFYLVMLQYI